MTYIKISIQILFFHEKFTLYLAFLDDSYMNLCSALRSFKCFRNRLNLSVNDSPLNSTSIYIYFYWKTEDESIRPHVRLRP
jgi:hypothetical protein